MNGQLGLLGFATAIPQEMRGSNETEICYRHKRRIESISEEHNSLTEDVSVYSKDSIKANDDLRRFSWDNPPQFFRDVPLAKPDQVVTFDQEKKRFRNKFPVQLRSSRTNTNKPRASSVRFVHLFGDLYSVALYGRSDREVIVNKDFLGIQEIADGLSSNDISPNYFLRHLQTRWIDPHGIHDANRTKSQDSLRALATIVKVYKSLPNATIPLSTISLGPLSEASWVPSRHLNVETVEVDLGWFEPTVFLPFDLTRRATFSCIALFESGGFNFLPKHLDRVMAISVGDSIYVAAPLLCDPSIQPAPHEVQRIAGNIGRAGLALLIPPRRPKTKKADLESYQLVNHDPFDGKLEDCFQSTTLHLAFSGYELPLDVGEHGGRNREAFFLESLVSVHDRGEWIADLDILSTFDDPKFQCIVDQPSCVVGPPRPIPNFPIVSIDSWHELLDIPLDVAVVRAHNNWLGRLAVASVSINLGCKTILFTGSACWKCGEETVAEIKRQKSYVADHSNQTAPKIVFIL